MRPSFNELFHVSASSRVKWGSIRVDYRQRDGLVWLPFAHPGRLDAYAVAQVSETTYVAGDIAAKWYGMAIAAESTTVIATHWTAGLRHFSI